MRPDTAIICAAGWDLITEATLPKEAVPFRCPETLYPIAPSVTVLSRLVAQLHFLQVETVYVGVGDPDNCPTERFEDRVKRHYGEREALSYGKLPGYGTPPWNNERVEYVESLGAYPLLMPDPLNSGYYDTLRRGLQYLQRVGGWERLVAMPGDYIFETRYLDFLLGAAQWSSELWLHQFHPMQFLDKAGVRMCLMFMSKYPGHISARHWHNKKALRHAGGLPQKHIWCEIEAAAAARSLANAKALARRDPVE